MLNYI